MGDVTRGTTKIWGWVEKTLFFGGVLLLAGVAGSKLYSHFASRSALNRFNAARAEGFARLGKRIDEINTDVDFSLWNPKRIVAYKESLVEKTSEPVAPPVVPVPSTISLAPFATVEFVAVSL